MKNSKAGSKTWEVVIDAPENLKFLPSWRVILVGRFDILGAREIIRHVRAIRRITLLTDNCCEEFVVEDHYRQGWKVDSTFFGEVALEGHWDLCLAQADFEQPQLVGQSAREIFRVAGTLVDATQFWLIPPIGIQTSPTIGTSEICEELIGAYEN